jgi:hypothetical protein
LGQQAPRDRDERAFSRTGWTHERDQFVVANREIRVIEGDHFFVARPVSLADVFELERAHRLSSPS